MKKKINTEKKVDYTLLAESKSDLVETLFKLYDKDPYTARVIYMNNNNRGGYANYRLVVFKEDKSFNIVLFKKTYGISKTNRIYNRESKTVNICYNNNKFHIIFGPQKTIRPLTIFNLTNNLGRFSGDVLEYLKKEFTWISFLLEKNILQNVAFNTIIKDKLYSYRKAIKHTYKIPYPVANRIHEHYINNNSTYDVQYFISKFKENLNYLENITSFNISWFKPKNINIFIDTLRMAKTLDKKINCKWSDKRLRLEHDLWSKELTNILFVDDDKDMHIGNIYMKFSEHSSFEILKTTKEMYYEGMKNNHCVATYVSKVNSGVCGIYRIGDYTLELIKEYGSNNLKIAQFRGYSNIDAPKELYNLVLEKLNNFNNEVTDDLFTYESFTDDKLPF